MGSHATSQFAPRFWLLWGGQAASLAGSFAVQFALIWWLTATTGSATMLATATLVGLLPQVVLGPFIGALVDRWNRKRIMFAADSVIAIASAWLAWMFVTEAATVGHVFVVLAIRAVGGAFHGPAMLASTSLMVPEQHYVRIQGLNQALQGGSPLIAAPLGALLISNLTMGSILLIDVGTALVALIPLALTAIPQPAATDAQDERKSVLGDVRDGIAYLGGHRGELYLVFGATLVNFCVVPAFALLPLFVLQELNGNAYSLSWLHLTFGAGGIVGGSILASWGGFRRRLHTVLFGFALMGIATFVLGTAQAGSLLLPLAAMLFVGGSASLINGAIIALLQQKVAADYQGRLFTLLGSIAGAMTPIALLLAAPIAEWYGIRFWYLCGGAICALFACVALFIPALSTLEDTPLTQRPLPTE